MKIEFRKMGELYGGREAACPIYMTSENGAQGVKACFCQPGTWMSSQLAAPGPECRDCLQFTEGTQSFYCPGRNIRIPCPANIGRSLKSKRRVERSRISRGFGKQHEDRGTSERILGCLTVRASWNSIFMHQSRIVLSSTLALSFCIALVFLLVLAALLQGVYSPKKKHMHGQRMRHKIASREGWASSVKTLGTGHGVMYAGQIVKIECLKVKFECLKVKFEWLKGQRSVQHPEDIRVNECTPRECTLACKARGFLKVKFECLKVKFEWLRRQRSVQHPEDIRVNECTPRECTLACKVRGFW